MSQKPIRRNFSIHEKVILLKRHLVDKIPVSNLCEQENIQPSIFYKWQKDLFDNASEILDLKARKRGADSQQRRFKDLQNKIEKKNEVIAELMGEHIKLKKEFGEI